jgi:hypothetical protein
MNRIGDNQFVHAATSVKGAEEKAGSEDWLTNRDRRRKGSGCRGYGRAQPVGKTANRCATADHKALGADKEASDNGHNIGTHDAGKDNSVHGVETHVDDGSDVPFRSCMGKENYHQEAPWAFANVSTERVKDEEKEKPGSGRD